MESKKFLFTTDYCVVVQTDRYFYVIWIQLNITRTLNFDIGMNVQMAQRFNLKHEQRIGQLLYYRRVRRATLRQQEIITRRPTKRYRKHKR